MLPKTLLVLLEREASRSVLVSCEQVRKRHKLAKIGVASYGRVFMWHNRKAGLCSKEVNIEHSHLQLCTLLFVLANASNLNQFLLLTLK